MKATLNYIQAVEGGSVSWEGWTAQEPFRNNTITLDVLKTRTVELPEGWTVGRTADGTRNVFDNDKMAVVIKGGYNSAIYALSGESKEKFYLRKVD